MPKSGDYSQITFLMVMLLALGSGVLYLIHIFTGGVAGTDLFFQAADELLGVVLWLSVGVLVAILVFTLSIRWWSPGMVAVGAVIGLAFDILVTVPVLFGAPFGSLDIMKYLLFSNAYLRISNGLQSLGASRNLGIILAIIFLSAFMVITVNTVLSFRDRVSGKDIAWRLDSRENGT